MRNKNKPNPFKVVNELKTKLAFKEQDHKRALKKMKNNLIIWQVIVALQLLLNLITYLKA
jgi:hypothetical protein